MGNNQEQIENENAYERIAAELDVIYPKKQFVAFGHGTIIGNSADFYELLDIVRNAGRDPDEVMVVRIGDEPPSSAAILSPFYGRPK